MTSQCIIRIDLGESDGRREALCCQHKNRSTRTEGRRVPEAKDQDSAWLSFPCSGLCSPAPRHASICQLPVSFVSVYEIPRGTVPNTCRLSARVSSPTLNPRKGGTGRARNALTSRWQPQKIKAISGRRSEMPSSQGKGRPRKFWFREITGFLASQVIL